ncbi:MAG: hypothetical protein L0Y56_19295, partial [Nitrospira sp.]|nr:hypothetical protein [Nitrospira sp.]
DSLAPDDIGVRDDYLAVEAERADLSYLDTRSLPPLEDNRNIYGVGKLVAEAERESYGLSSEDVVEVASRPTPSRVLLKKTLSFQGDQLDALFEPCVDQRWKRDVVENPTWQRGGT